MPSSRPTREQQRAQAVYERVSKVQKEKWNKDYGRQCLRLPAMIQQCGLCQALAFLEAKGAGEKDKPFFHFLLEDLAQVIQSEPWRTFSKRVLEAELGQYLRLSHEAVHVAQWFKRYAEALLRVVPGEDGGQRA